MGKVKIKPDISRKISRYTLVLLFFLGIGFFLSSYVITKGYYYAAVINYAGKIRGNIQRFVKLYLGNAPIEKLNRVVFEIENDFRILNDKVDYLRLPILDSGSSFKPVEIEECWYKLKNILFKNSEKVEILVLSEVCWKKADNQTNFYQRIAQRNFLILSLLFYVVFATAFLIIILLIRLNFREISGKLEKRATFDALTNILNRAALKDIYSSISYDTFFHPMSLILFDLDDFKKINDTYGHNIGDKVLKEVAKAVKEKLRKSDIFARWGGEEFVIILPHTDLSGAKVVAEKLRAAVESLNIPELKGKKVTASFGVTLLREGETLENGIFRADVALYKAKKLGKNRVEINPPGEKV